MDYVCLGRTGLRVSRLCLGTMNFGSETSQEASFEILDRAIELGINLVDTADVYNWKVFDSSAEEILGRWFAQGNGRRDKVILATKVYGMMGLGPNERGLSAYHIRHACEESLRKLQTDRIDLFQMHHIDLETPVEEFLEAMEHLVRQGKVLYVGSSNFPAWHLAEVQLLARQRHFLGLVSEQCLYSLADRTVELEVLPACKRFGLGVLTWSPLRGGLLAGALQPKAASRRKAEFVQTKLAVLREKVERFEAFCTQCDESPERVALAWILANPIITAPIIGPRTVEQLVSSCSALELAVDADMRAALDRIWPGPGGTAPDAYSF